MKGRSDSAYSKLNLSFLVNTAVAVFMLALGVCLLVLGLSGDTFWDGVVVGVSLFVIKCGFDALGDTLKLLSKKN